MTTELPVTRDRLLNGRVLLTQPRHGYRAAIDPVLLAAAVAPASGESVLDLGCGVGAAALCLMARVPGLRLTGLEIQPELARLARLNAAANGAADFTVVDGSAEAPPARWTGFDHVMTNPPYVAAGRGTPPPGILKATANMEGGLDLAGWIKAAARLVRPKGSLTLIHRADRLAELLAAFAGRGLGRVRVVPLWPKAGRPAGRIIVSAVKGSRAPLEILPGLILHRDDGGATAAAEAILRDAAALTAVP